LDLATVLLLHKSSFLVGAFCFAYVKWQSPKASKGLGSLAVGFLLLAFASTVAGWGEKEALPFRVWTIGSFSVGVLGYAAIWVGIKRLSSGNVDVKDWIALFLPVLLVAVALATGFHLENQSRGTMFNANASIFLGASAVKILWDSQREPLSARFLLGATLVGATALTGLVLSGIAGWQHVADDVRFYFFLLIICHFAVSLFTLIFVNERAEAELRKLLETDVLTGVKNRRWFYSKLPASLDPGDCFIILDIDNFKRVNDQFGHEGGDVALKAVAQEVARQLRPADAFARLGGEEFGIFVRDHDEAGARMLAERIRIAIRVLHVEYSTPISLSISAGVGVCKEPQPPEDLFKATDQALYAAKGLGRDKVVLVDEMQVASLFHPESVRSR
jgi:diguanylate cyclase (GGDEF)-like protein